MKRQRDEDTARKRNDGTDRMHQVATEGLPLWHDIGFGFLLMALVLVAAELLARYVEAEAGRRRAVRSDHAVGMVAGHTVVAEECR